MWFQHWFDHIDDNLANKTIYDYHKDESTHAYNTYLGENRVCWKTVDTQPGGAKETYTGELYNNVVNEVDI